MSNTSATGGPLLPNASSPPLEDVDLDAVFQQLIVALTGLDGTLVRPRWQPTIPKQPPASTNWCAVGVTTSTPDANAAIVHDGNANGGLGQDDMYRHEEINVLATFYGPNASMYAKQARDGFAIDQNRESLKSQNFNYVNSEAIPAVPELVDQQWIRRFDLTMHFRRQVVRTYPVENILSAEVDYFNQQFF